MLLGNQIRYLRIRMAVQSTNVNRPKRQKGSSKKSKASWRKNTEIEDIEDFIEDQRLEERLGGAFDKRSDSELFVLDNTTNEALIPGKAYVRSVAKRPDDSGKALHGWGGVYIASRYL